MTPPYLAAGEAPGSGLDDLEFRDGGIAEPIDLGQARPWGRDHLAERAEFRNQGFCERLHVAAGQRTKQDEFEQLIVGDRIAPGLAETPAQALPVAMIMGRRFRDARPTPATIFRHDAPPSPQPTRAREPGRVG